MDWRNLARATVGHEATYEFVEPYTASLIFFAITMMTGILLRSLTRAFIPPEGAQDYFVNFISTMEMCAYFFENNFVLKYYGAIVFFLTIAAQLFVCNRTFGGSSENPVKAFHDFLEVHSTAQKAIINIIIQTFAGIASYRFAKMIWSLDLIADHHTRFYEGECDSDLHVTLFYGMSLELCACLIESYLSMQTLLSRSVVDEVVKIAISALMITLGVHMTGMYINPAMATGHSWGCKGVTSFEHVVIYWLGPFIGCWLAVNLNRRMHIDRSIKPEAKDKDSKKKE